MWDPTLDIVIPGRPSEDLDNAALLSPDGV
jgi:hypothetical protein